MTKKISSFMGCHYRQNYCFIIICTSVLLLGTILLLFGIIFYYYFIFIIRHCSYYFRTLLSPSSQRFYSMNDQGIDILTL